ncbi:hypothetical protein AK812_SmicGene15364 [Symbiodinium microadriaticum]|uniref:Reverse transcriptase domain-containing protein n=1 Tax=Symbiodinium microadriaticum TaxID=2951 RepID=A0A1Q9E364_SYMMI|nr:hypothetical protein AK812_SmicGene15364 [Symbiodinium microadriaticum]
MRSWTLLATRFVASHIVERFDPAKRWAGRIGGIRYIDRANKHPADHTFITAYAPQESASEIDRQLFFTELQLLLHGLPRRTNTWLMGDFNAHVGPDSHFRSVGPCNAEVTNDNGIMLGHLCDSAGLSLANTFHPAGSTWWSANRESSHRIDYVAIQHSFRRRLKLCHVNKLLGRRWQTSTTPDHYPVEVLVGLKAGWPPRRPQRTPQQWNRQALLSACTDPVLAAPFLRDVADSLTQHHDEFTSSKSLQEQWTSVNDTLHGIAMKHFSKHPEQRNSKIQPQTFAILQQRRDATQTFMHARQCLTLAGCNQRVPHLLRVIVLGWRVVKLMAQARQAVKDDLRAWERQLECNLLEAMRANNHREAWSVSRQLAGRNFRKHGERQPPPAKSISKASWLQHFRQVQNAVECVGSAGFVPDPSPDYRIFFEGEEGCNCIAAAARRMPRDRATPRGSLPIELWSLIMQGQTGLMIMPYLELFQAMGINPSLWCEGHGCPIPKPGGDPTPNGMRVINLLDPLGKAFYKAAFQSHADTSACHQYGYSAKCSRRDAILQVTTLLQRLRMARMCTAANLYDLTKAFDMLSSQSVLQDLQQHQPFCPTIVAMLEDMQQRLLIHLPLSSGGSLHVHVRDGVLQGGGTGPRLFRRVYDTVVGDWQQRTTPEACLTRVSYEDSVLDLSTSAYADDLLRVEAADTADGIEAATVEHTRDLQNDLQPHRLQLNLRKCESLVSIRGRGSYVAARSLFSGAWKGLPLKPSVKYLGTHLQPFDSAKLDVTMRIAAARSAFAMFSKFLRRASVPLRRKILVFNAVVNEALLSVLEVRVLTGSDYQRLEAARGLLLRRLFGRHGYGKVADDQAPHSVPLSLLRQVCGLAEVEVELRVRRLLWLRSSLLAEQAGDTRLELASLFGRLEWQLTSPVDAEGGLTSVAPTFLHVLDRDIRQVMAQWDGFRPGWKHAFLAVGVSTIRSLRGASIQRHQQHDFPMIPGSRAQDGSNPMPDHAQDLTKPGDNAVMQTQFVDNPAEFVRSMRVLSDGTIPDIDAGLTSEHWTQLVRTVGGSSHLFQPAEDTFCISLVRKAWSTMVTLVQLLVSGSAHVRLPSALPQPVRADIRSVGHLSFSILPMASLGFMAAVQGGSNSPVATAPQKRQRQSDQAGKTRDPLDVQVQQLSKQLRTVMKIVNQHDKELRDLEAWSCHTFLLPKEHGLAKELLQAMTSWKARIPDKGAHPLGPPRWTVAGTVAQALLQDESNLGKLEEFKALHESMTTLQDMEQSIQLAVARETRDGKVLLKLRPQVRTQAEWAPALEILGSAVTSNGGEIKSGPAPPSALIRQIADKKE